MKSVLKSIKPYWVYLIITKKKTIEVVKEFPKAKNLNKTVEVYCSKDKKSFNSIPEKDREWMRKYIGKVACRFVCDRIAELPCEVNQAFWLKEKTCIDDEHYKNYLGNKNGYGWHISNLKIYDEPKELSDFIKPCPMMFMYCQECEFYSTHTGCCTNRVTRPPQSYMFVEEVRNDN